MDIKLNTKWNQDKDLYESDVNKEYDWVYLVDSFSYTRFEKNENIVNKLKTIKPYNAQYKKHPSGYLDCIIIGKRTNLFEKFERYNILMDNVILMGVHPDCIVEIENEVN